MVKITLNNIEDYRDKLTISKGDLPFDMWEVFDKEVFDATSNCDVIPISEIVSTKNWRYYVIF